MPSSTPSGSDRHVVLVGMMGTGKTTVGRLLAARLGRPFLDSDAVIEAETGRTVRQIFETDGEPAFRRLEAAALRRAVGSPVPSVIAAAGGTVLDPGNREVLRDAGHVVWLRADPAVLVERVDGADHRPLLAVDPARALERLDATRRPLYAEVADQVVDVDVRSPDEVVDVVLAAVA
jgi:shikimate kinase